MANLIIESTPDQVANYKQLAAEFVERLDAEGFPVIGKQPAHDHQWGLARKGRPGLQEANWDDATGYAVAPCFGSRLAILDIDDLNHESARKARQIIGKTLTVKRGNHLHIYIRLAAAMHKSTFAIQVLDLATMEKHEALRLRMPPAHVG